MNKTTLMLTLLAPLVAAGCIPEEEMDTRERVCQGLDPDYQVGSRVGTSLTAEIDCVTDSNPDALEVDCTLLRYEVTLGDGEVIGHQLRDGLTGYIAFDYRPHDDTEPQVLVSLRPPEQDDPLGNGHLPFVELMFPQSKYSEGELRVGDLNDPARESCAWDYSCVRLMVRAIHPGSDDEYQLGVAEGGCLKIEAAGGPWSERVHLLLEEVPLGPATALYGEYACDDGLVHYRPN